MGTHSFRYKEHYVVIDVVCDAAGLWGWNYTINSGTPTPGTSYLAIDAAEAINDAAKHAIHHVDHLKP